MRSSSFSAARASASRSWRTPSCATSTATRMPPEQVYHAFILGLLVHLSPHYLVRSNRESGQGRFDVMILPRSAGQPGVVLELKVKKKGETLKQALAKALGQIEIKDYA